MKPVFPDGMNERQTRFVEAYLIDPNGKKAAIAAGYSSKGAEVTASKLLRNSKVRVALNEAIAARAERVEVKADDVLRDIDRIAKAAEGAGEYTAALKGRELLGKHLGLFTDKLEHSGDAALTVVVQSLAAPKKGKKP